MYEVCAVTSVTSGHDGCAPVKVITGSPIMSIEGCPVARIGDICEDHGCISHITHTPVITEGSSILIVDGIPVARVGNAVAGGGCTGDHVLAQGKPFVSVEK